MSSIQSGFGTAAKICKKLLNRLPRRLTVNAIGKKILYEEEVGTRQNGEKSGVVSYDLCCYRPIFRWEINLPEPGIWLFEFKSDCEVSFGCPVYTYNLAICGLSCIGIDNCQSVFRVDPCRRFYQATMRIHHGRERLNFVASSF